VVRRYRRSSELCSGEPVLFQMRVQAVSSCINKTLTSGHLTKADVSEVAKL
jgi:hypothetical protein